MRSLFWSLISLCAVAAPALGQANPDSVHRRNECRRAIQIVQTGRPAPHQEWASGYIRLCGAEGRNIVVEAIRSARNTTDREVLERIYRPTLYLIDGSIFEAAAEVARDRSASEPARVYALRALVVVAEPRATPSYEQMIGQGAIGAGCTGGLGIHDLTTSGSPLPADVYQRSYALANVIIRDAMGEPANVREAARCVTWLAGKRLSSGAGS